MATRVPQQCRALDALRDSVPHVDGHGDIPLTAHAPLWPLAHRFRDPLLEAAPVGTIQDRRDVPDRRRATRAGRRSSDPTPHCVFCQLPVPDGPHTSEAECVEAIQGHLSRCSS